MTESAREPFHSLLLPIHLTAISDRVLGRVGLLPMSPRESSK